MPAPVSLADLHIYKWQTVQVFDPSGNYLGSWPDAPLLSGFKEAVNSAPQPIRLKLPRSFDDFDISGAQASPYGTVGLGNVVKFYLLGPGISGSGLLRYQGVIDRYEPTIAENGEESVTITITPLGAAIGDVSITDTVVFGVVGTTYVDPITMFTYWFTNNNPLTSAPYANPLTQDPSNPASTGVTKQYTFTNQSLGSIWQTAAQLAGTNWFFRINPDATVTFNQPPVTAQHQFVIGQHCTIPSYSKDTTGLKNVIHVIGNARQHIRLTSTLTSATPYTSLAVTPLPMKMKAGDTLIIGGQMASPNQQQVTLTADAAQDATTLSVSFTSNAHYSANTQVDLVFESIQHGSDLNIYGARVLTVSDSRITDQATADALATALLAIYDQPVYRMTLRVLDYRGDIATGIGYDIESIEVGDTCQLLNPGLAATGSSLWDNAKWDVATWDFGSGADTSQIAVIQALTYGFDYVDLEIGQLAPNQDVTLARLIQDFVISTTL